VDRALNCAFENARRTEGFAFTAAKFNHISLILLLKQVITKTLYLKTPSKKP